MSATPRTMPKRRTACSDYSEQLGTQRERTLPASRGFTRLGSAAMRSSYATAQHDDRAEFLAGIDLVPAGIVPSRA